MMTANTTTIQIKKPNALASERIGFGGRSRKARPRRAGAGPVRPERPSPAQIT
jgi:hypothetical protein